MQFNSMQEASENIPTFPYCSLTYGSHFPDLGTDKFCPSTTVILSFFPVLGSKFVLSSIDCWGLTAWALLQLARPSEYSHSLIKSRTVNCTRKKEKDEIKENQAIEVKKVTTFQDFS